jgi:glycosyltransferase involved in cell wall biosynthesis
LDGAISQGRQGGRRLRVVVNGVHAKSGGGVTYLRNILPKLSERDDLELHLFLHEDQYQLFYPMPDRIQVTLFKYREGFLPSVLWEQICLPIATWGMGADVVFSPANYGPLFARNHVILLRNATSVIQLTNRLRPMVYWLLLSAATLASLVTARKAVAVSKYAESILTFRLKWLFQRKLHVVYHGAKWPEDPLEDPPEDLPRNMSTNLLAVSDIYIQKNYHTLLKSISILREKYPDVRLTIVGAEIDTWYAHELRSMIQDLEISDNVFFVGHVDPDRLQKLYAECGIFVFPSIVETFGNPLLEAMAAGAAIASSNSAAMPEVIGDAGLLFQPHDAAEMAEKIGLLIEDRQLRIDLGKKAKVRSRLFDLSKTAEQTLSVLDAAAGTVLPVRRTVV